MTQNDCHGSIAFYDLSPRPRGSGLAAAAILAAVLAGCTAAPPPPTAAETQRVIMENWIVMQLKACRKEPLSQAQADFLKTRTEYGAQRYLLAIAEPAAAPCELIALKACEQTTPGDCIATPGERDGRRP